MCKTPNNAVIPAGSYLLLTTYRASHWNSLGIHTNEYNYRYHEHRPRRLLIRVDNSEMQGERNPGVCNWFCHIHSAGLSSFTEGLKCSFSSSQLPETHECCDTCQGRGENYFWNSSRGVKADHKGSLLSGHNPTLAMHREMGRQAIPEVIQHAHTVAWEWDQPTWSCTLIYLAPKKNPWPLQCMSALVLFPFTDTPSPLQNNNFMS